MLPRTLVRIALVVAASAFALAGLATPAGANEFVISTCAADRGQFSSQAFEDFATRGMMWKRACNPEGPGLRGLVTGNVTRPGRVPRGALSSFTLRAPEGTRFKRLWWTGEARRRDCRYSLQVYAIRPDGPPVSIKNVLANRHCPRNNGAQAARWPRALVYNINGATRIVQRVACVGAPGQPRCSSRGLNYIRTFSARAVVEDVSSPAVTITADNPFTQGAWVRGVQNVNYGASDNVGVKVARAVVGGLPRGDHQRVCIYSQPIPCTNGPGGVSVDTTRLAEGTQALFVEALDAADNGGISGAVTICVDNTAPGTVPLTVAGGDVWRNQNDFDLAWTNPDEGDRAPIARAHYRVCSASGADCTPGSVDGTGVQALDNLTVPGAGEWQVRMWREDAAGNQEPANASIPATLRFDPEPPELGFEPLSATDPTRVSVLVTDRVSGLAGGQIELSRQGSGAWQMLPTVQDGSRLISRIDDASLPAGVYLLRASARDQAANLNSSDRLLDGAPMAITLPLRVPTAMRAGVVSKQTARRRTRDAEKRRGARRRATKLEPRARVRFGRRVQIRGRLVSGNGRPVAGAEIQVLSGTEGAAEQLIGVVRTDARGRYRFAARATATRTLRFVYSGTAVMLPSQGAVRLRVSATSTIRAQPRALRNGGRVRFSGRLESRPAPPAGKLVELQVVLSGRWQTFRTTRTDAQGHWRIGYRFRRSCGLTRYRFRARLPAEAGYSFEIGRTRPVQVRVRGKPCR